MSKEVDTLEKALWVSVQAKSLLHPDVQSLYRSVCRGYENAILDNQDDVELRDIEYELWKVHYRHIFEFRKMVNNSKYNGKDVMERFNLFLSEAMEFYQGLIIKLKKKKPSSSVHYLIHRIFVCLGDLARYKAMNPDWSISATYYFKAIESWPDSGNPHNQLALLATYMGDHFLTSYHCVRSLAVKEPFPDARKNLILPFQTNMSSLLPSLSDTARFDFLTPAERCLSETETISSSSKLWPLFVRTMSFFFIQSRIEDFDWTFASTMQALDSLLELNDSSLRESLESYQFIEGDQERKGPYRSLQMVCISIFAVFDSLNNESHLVHLSLIATFVLMGRFVERCVPVGGKNKLQDCPLLPAVLVMVEWLVSLMKVVQKYLNNERVHCSISYFFDSLIEFLGRIDQNVCCNTRNALWEDYELRGFTPISKSHELLDFVGDRTQTTPVTPFNGYESRFGRILSAAKRIAEESKWICYDETRRRFYRTGMKQIPNTLHKENHSNNNIKVIAAEEEEVILFKPITRVNSAPPLTVGGEVKTAETSSDEDLRRAMSLSETSNTGSCRPLKENSAYPAQAGPPSLSSWVINDGCFQIEKGKELYKPGLSTIDETAGANSFHYPPPPIPSAPFIPDDAVWFNVSKDTSGILGSSPLTNHAAANWPIAHFSPPPPPVIGLSSSEWLRQYRSRQNLEQGSNVVWPVHHLYTNGFGDYYALDGSKLGFFDGWGNPVSPSQMVYLGSPQNPSGSLIYEQRRDKPVNGHHYRPIPPTAEVKAVEQQSPPQLLQYLKEKEWQIHGQPNFRGPPNPTMDN